MDPPEFPPRGSSSPRKEPQGTRGTPLTVSKDSHKIKKPTVASERHEPPPRHLHPTTTENRPQPVITYNLPPKVIQVKPSDFKNFVQRVTGNSPRPGNTLTGASACDVSSAARLASVEKVSPSKRERERQERAASDAQNVRQILEGSSLEMGQTPGILSPEPTTLPPVSVPELFSPPSISPSPSSSYDLFDAFCHELKQEEEEEENRKKNRKEEERKTEERKKREERSGKNF